MYLVVGWSFNNTKIVSKYVASSKIWQTEFCYLKNNFVYKGFALAESLNLSLIFIGSLDRKRDEETKTDAACY